MLIERIFITPFSLILSQLINNSKTMIYTPRYLSAILKTHSLTLQAMTSIHYAYIFNFIYVEVLVESV